MAITFPSSPSPGDIFTSNGKSWQYVNGKWEVYAETVAPDVFAVDAVNDVVNVYGSMAAGASASIAGDLVVDTNTLVIDSTNNRVGIGTTSPNAPLEISGSVNTELLRLSAPLTTSNQTNYITMVDSQDGEIVAAIGVGSDVSGANDNDGGISFATTTAASGSIPSTRMYINYAGNVGIGTTSPAHPLAVNGKAIVGGGDNQTPDATGNGHLMIDGSGYTGFASLDGAAMWVGHNSASRNLYLATNETARMTVDGAGNVGIGDTTPSYKLDVSGDARFTGSFYLTGFASVPVGEWQSYTPSLSTATLGNGSTTGYYMRVGNIIHAYARFTLGSTSGWDNRFSRISAPVAAKSSSSTATQDNANIVQVEVGDSSAGVNYIMGGFLYDSGANFRISGWRTIDATSGTGIRSGYFLDLSNDVTLADGDTVTVKAIYMADD